jgi:hypothetical protein
MVSASRENGVPWHKDGLGVRCDARASQGGARNVVVCPCVSAAQTCARNRANEG